MDSCGFDEVWTSFLVTHNDEPGKVKGNSISLLIRLVAFEYVICHPQPRTVALIHSLLPPLSGIAKALGNWMRPNIYDFKKRKPLSCSDPSSLVKLQGGRAIEVGYRSRGLLGVERGLYSTNRHPIIACNSLYFYSGIPV